MALGMAGAQLGRHASLTLVVAGLLHRRALLTRIVVVAVVAIAP